MFGLFKRSQKKQRQIDYAKETELLRRHRAEMRSRVYSAVTMIGKPCSMRMVAAHMQIDSGSVSPRLAELRKKNLITIAYRKRGLDGVWRNYYKLQDG